MEQSRVTDFDIREEDAEEDWTYAGADTRYMTHGLHTYPARMIPQIARRLVLNYSQGGELVWDPFCGSGSVLVESMLLGRRCIGTDLNPYAVFLSKVKTRPIEQTLLRETTESIIHRVKSLQQSKRKKVDIPDIPNIDYWFKPYVQRKLAIIREEINSLEDSTTKDFLRLCFALTVREVSNLKKREFKIVRMRKPKLEEFRPDVFQSFVNQVRRCVPLMKSFTTGLPENVEMAEVLEVDNRAAPINPKSVDLVVTSPPYGDHGTTVAYGQFSRYPALWIDLDSDDVRTVDRRGLGGRNTREYSSSELPSETLVKTYEKVHKNSPKRARQLYNFMYELNESFQSIHEKLRHDARACIVVGNRLMSRVRIPTNAIIVELGSQMGLEHECTIPRSIPIKRMPWQNAPENVEGSKADTMHTENIIILRRG
ncbi:MAG: DNA methyltransferase [Candidatus Thorarchaeota archaeon]